MKKALNPNAGEFRPPCGVFTLASLNERGGSRSSSLQGGAAASPASLPQRHVDGTADATSDKGPFLYSDESVEARFFIPVSRSLMECRAAFYEHPESSPWKHLEFERLLRRCFFAAHDANELSISFSSMCGRFKPFWLSYSPSYFLMAHDVVQEIEIGTSHTSDHGGGKAGSTTPAPTPEKDGPGSSNEAAEESCRREKLREVYLRSVRPLVPCALRKRLATHAKRSSAASGTDVNAAITYALDIFFLFTRLQFLQFLDVSAGSSYSACVQFLTRLRERLFKSEVTEHFLNVVLVLILISSVHLASAQRAMEVANEEILSRLKVQCLFCAYFPVLAVAFLAGSPLQSMEELRYACVATSVDECLPALRNCPRGAVAVKELMSYNNKTAMLWSITLDEVVTCCLRHMAQRDRDIHTFLLADPTALDEHLHVCHPTVLSCLFNSANSVEDEETEEMCQNQEQQGHVSRSDEFHRLAMEAATTSSGSEYETVYFSLLALVNMDCFTPTEISCLFAALEDTNGNGRNPSAFQLFLSSPVCASLHPAASELLDVLSTLMRRGKLVHLRALREVQFMFNRRLESSRARKPSSRWKE
ncbi:hypothetical protein DQ04_00931100 [Trypanosoma grayi]|uniref:hypothetical protein n=1 Tax=Trypanosoma grayi TaxID=71804 RepID=UPI0004F47DE1|nr:hypothetical protein DQ04_00931100 [Trypanosoma grayi]KEG13562.1 hypothetical protein DQ04_00931100 [Trypanosoma grayi]